MTDQSAQLQQQLSNAAIQEAMKSIGPMPFLGSGWTSATSIIDPNAIASEIFGLRLDRVDLAHRKSLIDALTRSFPILPDPEKTGRFVVGHQPASESFTTQASGFPLVGPLATAAAALQALSKHAAGIDEIQPLSGADDDRPHEPILVLIHGIIDDLVRQFINGRPIVQQVDVDLRTLFGSILPKLPLQSGYLHELEERCGINPENISTIDDEKIFTNFSTLVALALMFAQAWEDARKRQDSHRFFAIDIQDLQRYLFAIGTALSRLRALVPPAAWATTEIGTTPPIIAGDFYNWMQEYVSTTAPAILRQGRDGVFAVCKTMKEFDAILNVLELPPAVIPRPGKPGQKQKDRKPAPGVDPRGHCAGVPGAFDDEEIQDVIHELLCHVQHVIDATCKANDSGADLKAAGTPVAE
jgi:hypothetical protein